MPTVRQLADSIGAPSGRGMPLPAAHPTPKKPLMLVIPGTSAIEYIVATARPGEVVYVTDAEYYNPYLWRNYEGEQ